MKRPLSIVVCLLLVVGIALLQNFVLSKDEMVAPITTSGTTGESVVTEDFTLEVVETDLSTTLRTTDGLGTPAEPAEANGVWMLVWARVTAEHTTMTHFPAELRMKDGSTYFERGWFPEAMDRATLSPGVPLYGAFVFELPTDRIEEPTLIITHAPGFERRLGAQATIDLAMTDTSPSDEPVDLLPPEVRIGEDSDAAE